VDQAVDVKPVMLRDFERAHVRPRRGPVLIVGSKLYRTKRDDRRSQYADVLGVDMQPGEGVDRVLDLEEPLPSDLGPFAHVECMSVLEHSRRPWLLAANLERLLLAGGTLFLSVPFMWRIHGYPEDYWRFTPSGIRTLFPRVQWQRLCFGHQGLSEDRTIPQIIANGHIYFARTEVYGFGVKG
jgi:hypothetical protein